MLLRKLKLLLLGVLLAWPLAAHASVLTFAFDGHITAKNDSLSLLTFAGVGDEVTYTFSFDSGAQDTSPQTTLGTYSGLSSGLHVANSVFVGGSPAILVQHPGDLLEVSSNFDVSLAGLEPEGFAQFVLNDQSESNALTDDQLPLEPLALDLFRAKYFEIQFAPANWGYDPPILSLIGTIDTFTPEPGFLSILALGIVFCQRARPKRPH